MGEGIDEKQLKEWENLAEKATVGPWHVQWESKGILAIYGPRDDYTHVLWSEVCPSCQESGSRCTAPSNEDADFIAAARTGVPALVAEVRRLRKQGKRDA